MVKKFIRWVLSKKISRTTKLNFLIFGSIGGLVIGAFLFVSLANYYNLPKEYRDKGFEYNSLYEEYSRVTCINNEVMEEDLKSVMIDNRKQWIIIKKPRYGECQLIDPIKEIEKDGRY